MGKKTEATNERKRGNTDERDNDVEKKINDEEVAENGSERSNNDFLSFI